MFGIRVLIYILGIALVIWILFRLARGPKVAKKSTRKVGDMVQCAYCGTFIPRNEAIPGGDKLYCSQAHRDEDH